MSRSKHSGLGLEEVSLHSHAASISSAEYWNDVSKNKKMLKYRTLVYPKFKMKLTLECTRRMQCFIIVQKRVNGILYPVGRTDSTFGDVNKLAQFSAELESIYHVGIDSSQSLLFSIMDGDMLGVSDGYLFAEYEMPIQSLLYSENNTILISREDNQVSKLCSLKVQITLDNDLQKVSLSSKDPLSTGFFAQEPPTVANVREATPFFTEVFGTYVIGFDFRDLCNENTVDPSFLNAENTSVYVRLCLSDPLGVVEDTDTEEGGLHVLWQSLSTQNKKKVTAYNILCPELKISHKELVGSHGIETRPDSKSHLVVQVMIKGLTKTGDSNTPPELLSHCRIPVIHVISEALATKEGEEAEVTSFMASLKNKYSQTWSIHRKLHQGPKKLTRVKHHMSESGSSKKESESESNKDSNNSSKMISLIDRFTKKDVDEEEDYDSFEDEMDILAVRVTTHHHYGSKEHIAKKHADKLKAQKKAIEEANDELVLAKKKKEKKAKGGFMKMKKMVRRLSSGVLEIPEHMDDEVAEKAAALKMLEEATALSSSSDGHTSFFSSSPTKSKQSKQSKQSKNKSSAGGSEIHKDAEDLETLLASAKTKKSAKVRMQSEHGLLHMKVGRALARLVIESGDDIYEEKLKIKYKKVVIDWNKQNLIEFQQACDIQKELTSRNIKNFEISLNPVNEGLRSSLVVDLNNTCLQHVNLKNENIKTAKMQGDPAAMSYRSCTYTGSYVLEATTSIYEALGAFTPNNSAQLTQFFAGGGANPPSKSHPSRGYSRTVAYPLCHELLLSAAEGSSTPASKMLERISPFAFEEEEGCSGGTSEDVQAGAGGDWRSNLVKKIDPRGDLLNSMDPRDWYGNDLQHSSWQGFDYNQTRTYADREEMIKGFMEAVTIYAPSVQRNNSMIRDLHDPPTPEMRKIEEANTRARDLQAAKERRAREKLEREFREEKERKAAGWAPPVSPFYAPSALGSKSGSKKSASAGIGIGIDSASAGESKANTNANADSIKSDKTPSYVDSSEASSEAEGSLIDLQARSPGSHDAGTDEEHDDNSSVSSKHTTFSSSSKGSNASKASVASKASGFSSGKYSKPSIHDERRSQLAGPRTSDLGYKRQQEKEQNYRIRFQACNVGTAQTLDKTSDAFYNNLPWDMQYDYVDSLDVDALEVLLAQGQEVQKGGVREGGANPKPKNVSRSQKYRVNRDEEYSYHQQELEDASKGIRHDSVEATKHPRCVVWVLGQCPNKKVLEKAGKLFEHHMVCRQSQSTLLLVALAAETRFDLPQTDVDALQTVANPFQPLMDCFQAATESAYKKIRERHECAAEYARGREGRGTANHASYANSTSSGFDNNDNAGQNRSEFADADGEMKEGPSPSSGLDGSKGGKGGKDSKDSKFDMDGKFKGVANDYPAREYNELLYMQKSKSIGGGFKKGEMVQSPLHNIALAHYLTFAEVVGSAYEYESNHEDERSVKTDNGSIHTHTNTAASVSKSLVSKGQKSQASVVQTVRSILTGTSSVSNSKSKNAKSGQNQAQGAAGGAAEAEDSKKGLSLNNPLISSVRRSLLAHMPRWLVPSVLGRVNQELDFDPETFDSDMGGVADNADNADNDNASVKSDITTGSDHVQVYKTDKQREKEEAEKRKKLAGALSKFRKYLRRNIMPLPKDFMEDLDAETRLKREEELHNRKQRMLALTRIQSQRCNGFGELLEMKARFDGYRTDAFVLQIRKVLGLFLQSNDILGEEARLMFGDGPIDTNATTAAAASGNSNGAASRANEMNGGIDTGRSVNTSYNAASASRNGQNSQNGGISGISGRSSTGAAGSATAVAGDTGEECVIM